MPVLILDKPGHIKAKQMLQKVYIELIYNDFKCMQISIQWLKIEHILSRYCAFIISQ